MTSRMRAQSPGDLAIIIVSHNSRRFLRRCLLSLARSTDSPTFQVILVDNASSDGTVQMVRKSFPWVHVLPLSKNQGFARACNRAVRATRAPHVLFLNPDIEIEPDAIGKIKEKLASSERIGVLGGLVFDSSGRPQHGAKRQIPGLIAAFFYFSGLSRLFPQSATLNRYAERHTPVLEEREVGSVSGAFMLVRRDVFDLVGGFDERFFLYAEDMDLCKRIAEKGFKVVYFPPARAVHHHRTSTSKTPLLSTYHFYRSMAKFYAKHHGDRAGRLLSPLVHAACWILFAYQAILGQRMRLSGGLVRTERPWVRFLFISLDLASAIGSWFLAVYARFGDLKSLPPFRDYRSYVLFLAVLIVVMSGSMISLKAYRLRPRAAATATKSALLVFVILNLVFFYVKPLAFSRLVLVYFSSFLFLSLLLWRLVFHVVVRSPFGARLYVKRIALAGGGNMTGLLLAKLESLGDRYQIVGVIGMGEPVQSAAFTRPYLGSYPEVVDLVENYLIDDVIIVESDDGKVDWLALAGSLKGSRAGAKLLTRELASRLERGESLSWEDLPPLP